MIKVRKGEDSRIDGAEIKGECLGVALSILRPALDQATVQQHLVTAGLQYIGRSRDALNGTIDA